ncbi:hypothetical protein AYO20_07384 [Fonsecaea nubica]|uniref:Uncharacterized protein n=1 Tax=Fonsecaea nubica TaxID=856822 RepID=A0A178CW38_9EURO|nr:hypothetical protein AYO20_07384 [Fonsecaea nubica]OAL33373.1 hypothetical protein AYO20_07384 [Fonsecaea nubica]
MSDIEDYTYSPYDDLEDILWDADPTPELADDLAEHAVHSPVYQEEDAVKNEMSEYFSDWEYYSDDYMDDDPTLLRKIPQPARGKNTLVAAQNSRRGKKRKLIETIDVLPSGLDEVKLLTSSIKGTIWAQQTGQKIPAHKDEQEKVALMKNWKDVFAIKDNGWNQSTGQAEDDESWANEMSLADMGLKHVQRQPSFDATNQDASAEIEEDDEVAESMAEEPSGEEHVEQAISSKEDPGPDATNCRDAIVGKIDDERVKGYGQGGQDLGSGGRVSQSGVLVEDEIPRKRRRVKAELPSPPDSSETVVVDANDPTAMVNGKELRRDRPPDIHRPGSRRENKRKATDELDEVDHTNSTPSNRAKRVASKAATTRSTH